MQILSLFICMGISLVISLVNTSYLHAQQSQELSPRIIKSLIANRYLKRLPEVRVAEIDSVLDLTDNQRNTIYKLYNELAEDISKGDANSYQIGSETFADILTEEQIKMWSAYNMQQNIDERINRIDRAVELSADQRATLIPIIKKEIQTIEVISAQISSCEQYDDITKLMRERIAIQKETAKALSMVLTQEQRYQYNAMIKVR